MNRIIRDGTSQEDRVPPALDPAYFRPDELSLTDLLYLGGRHAALLNFYNLGNQPEGHWQALFTADESALLAMLLTDSRDVAPLHRDFRRFLLALRACRLGLAPAPAPESAPLLCLARRIECWRQYSRANPGAAAQRLFSQIEGLIRSRLSHAVTAQIQHLARLDAPATGLLAELGPDWHSATPTPLPAPEADSREEESFLSELFLTGLHALGVLRRSAEQDFPDTLESGQHDPALGLYLSFAQLYAQARSPLDDFSQRLLRFYYDQVLRFRPQPPQPDSTYLVCQPDGATAEVSIARGTRFLGGETADGRNWHYAAADELRFGPVRLAALQTLFCERDGRRSPEDELIHAGEGRSAVTAIRIGSLPTTLGKTYRPLFGHARRDGPSAAAEPARLGFAVASPLLLLQEGQREIRLLLHYRLPTPPASPPAGRKTYRSLEELLDTLSGNTPGATREGAFFKAFARMFRIELTTPEGWRSLGGYLPGCKVVEPALPEHCLSLQLTLPENFPPVVGHQPERDGEDYGTAHPILRLTLAEDPYFYPYSFLSQLLLQEVELEVSARRCRQIQVANQYGPLNADVSFPPFGPQPNPGAYLVIGSQEAFSKPLTALELQLKWEDLPPAGLEAHYRDYGLGWNNDSFQARLSALSDRQWQPTAKADTLRCHLFAQLRPDGSTRIDCQSLLPYYRPWQGQGDYLYSPQATSGFLRLALSAPEQAFGHLLHPQLLTTAMSRNARLESLGPLQRLLVRQGPMPLPNPPYTPSLGGLSLSYRASLRIPVHQSSHSDSSDRLYHLHPFGVETLRLAMSGDTPLLPRLSHDANLLLGLEAEELGGPLSLYFHLRDDSSLDMDSPPVRCQWFMLQAQGWQALEPFRILSDTTRGFLRSGIIRLDLPPGRGRDNRTMPAGLHWLRLSTDDDTAGLCSVHSVQPHGLKVVRVLESPRLGPTVLPAGSIVAPETNIPGLATVLQPGNSFAGAPEEDLAALTLRAGERLRHKQRAITPWDYERLVLQRFPQLHKVKCFAHTRFHPDPAERHAPGHVLLLVIPRRLEQQEVSEGLRANALVLKEIQSWLQPLCPVGVTLDVRNPVFERIQVRTAVQFHDVSRHGQWLKLLNRAIGEFISPWSQQGNTANFGWSLNSQELQGHLQGLPFVEKVWGLSLLRVLESRPEHFTLEDTARPAAATPAVAQAAPGVTSLHPLYPWSIAIPFRHHLIETADTLPAGPEAAAGPWPSGISRLQIGQTFVLSRNLP